jgi:translation initiation factor IF-3
VPVPRRFDRRPPERDTTRINERIRVPEVRLIGEDGQQVGILKTPDALTYAQERDLDLVEVAPEARPPVCRVLDYSKYKYEQAQKHKDKVKITIMFRGREVTHPERGEMLLNRLAEELAELAIVEQRPIQDGRNMTMMLGPSKAVLAEELASEKAKGDETTAAEAAAPEPEAPAAEAAPEPEAETPAEPEAAAEPEAVAEPEPEPAADAPAEAEAEAPAADADGDDDGKKPTSAAKKPAAKKPAAKRAAAR